MRGIPVNGKLIQTIRTSQGLTQERMAAEADCDVKTLRKAEKSGHVDQSTVERLAQTLGVEPQELIDAGSLEQETANIQLILDWQKVFNRRDPAAIADFFHEDGSVTVMSDIPIPGGGEFSGKEAVYQWANICFEPYLTEPITPDMMQIDAIRDLVFVRGKIDVEVTVINTNQSGKASATHEFRIRDGKILTHRVVTNTALFAKLIEKAEEEAAEEG